MSVVVLPCSRLQLILDIIQVMAAARYNILTRDVSAQAASTCQCNVILATDCQQGTWAGTVCAISG
jgi:hypothetical protein